MTDLEKNINHYMDIKGINKICLVGLAHSIVFAESRRQSHTGMVAGERFPRKAERHG